MSQLLTNSSEIKLSFLHKTVPVSVRNVLRFFRLQRAPACLTPYLLGREPKGQTRQSSKCSNINIPSFHAEQRSQMADILPRVQTSGFHSKVNFEVVTPFKFKLLLRVIWTQQQYLLYLQGIKCILQPVASRKFCVLSYSGLLPLGM